MVLEQARVELGQAWGGVGARMGWCWGKIHSMYILP